MRLNKTAGYSEEAVMRFISKLVNSNLPCSQEKFDTLKQVITRFLESKDEFRSWLIDAIEGISRLSEYKIKDLKNYT